MRRILGIFFALAFAVALSGVAQAAPQAIEGPKEIPLEQWQRQQNGQTVPKKVSVEEPAMQMQQLLNFTPQPFPSDSGSGVFYARHGVELKNPFKVFIAQSSPMPRHGQASIEELVREEFKSLGLPPPFPLARGKLNLLLRIETKGAFHGYSVNGYSGEAGLSFVQVIIYYTPVENVIFKE